MEVLDFIETNYPEHDPIRVLDNGEIIIFYLRYAGEKSNHGERDLTVYYNTWYRGDFTVNAQVPLVDGKLEKYAVQRMGVSN